MVDFARRFPCPACKGEGFIWTSRLKGPASIHTWHAAVCYECDGCRVVKVDQDGWVTGPDANLRYFCDHGQRIAEDCTKCGRTTQATEARFCIKCGEQVASTAHVYSCEGKRNH